MRRAGLWAAGVGLASAILAGVGLVYAYKASFPKPVPPVQIALTAAVRDHIKGMGVPIWPGGGIGFAVPRARLDGTIAVMGQIFGPEDDGVSRRAEVFATLRRVCVDPEPACFRVVTLRIDGRELIRPASTDLRGTL